MTARSIDQGATRSRRPDFGSAEHTTLPVHSAFRQTHKVAVGSEHWIDVNTRTSNKGVVVRGRHHGAMPCDETAICPIERRNPTRAKTCVEGQMNMVAPLSGRVERRSVWSAARAGSATAAMSRERL